MKLFYRKTLILFLFLIPTFSIGQTGPAGVGNLDGSNGEPRNILWVDADALSLSNGASVNGWSDKSGNTHNMLSGSSNPTYVTSVLNGKSIVRFDRTNSEYLDFYSDFASTTNGVHGSTYSFFWVASRRTTVSNQYVFGGNTGSSNRNLYSGWGYPGGQALGANHWNNNCYDTLGGYYTELANEFGFVSCVNNAASVSGVTRELFDNGTSIATINNSTDLSGITGQALGQRSGTNYADVDIAEVIFYKENLNIAQRKIVENYLSQKYNIAFQTPADDKFVSGDASYNVALTGIGKESDGSKDNATCEGLLLTQNGSFDNGDYLLCAHDGSANAVTTAADYTPGTVEEAWSKAWYIEQTGNLDAKISFDMSDGISGFFPANISNYRLLYRAGTSGAFSVVPTASTTLQNNDQVAFDVTSANIANGYYTLATIDSVLSPAEGLEGKKWYSFISGDWDDSNIWTLDPSGFSFINPNSYTPTTSPTGPIDDVVIISGKTVTINTNNKANGDLYVEGILDFKSTNGHNFITINGSGRVELSSGNFPSGDAIDFYSKGQGEGTVRFYGGSYPLDSDLKTYNLEIILDNSANIVTLTKDYLVNGKFLVHTGVFQINDNVETSVVNITVKGNVNIETNGQIATGTADVYTTNTQYHQFIIQGDFTNNGSAKFTNRVAPDYLNDDLTGAVEVIFNNATINQNAQFNGTTVFNQLTCDKGTDATYILEIAASTAANFVLYGRNDKVATGNLSLGGDLDAEKALRLLAGTLKLGNNIVIPSLSAGTEAYDIDSDAKLWLTGNSSVNFGGTTGLTWLAIYGILQVSNNATFVEASNYGTILRYTGTLFIESGTVDLTSMRTSSWGGGGTHVGSYVQTGGTVNINDEGANSRYAAFHLPFQSNVFQMTGGTLLIKDQGNGGDGDDFALIINSSVANYVVTGGTVIMDMSTNADYRINTRAPLWNLIVRNSDTNPHIASLTPFISTNTSTVTINPALPLVVLNDFTLEGANSPTFNANGTDMTIGGDWTIEDNVTFLHGNNTVIFKSTDKLNHDIDIQNTTTPSYLKLYNVIFDLDKGSANEIIRSSGRSTTWNDPNAEVMTIENDLTFVSNGTFQPSFFHVVLEGNLKSIYHGNIRTSRNTSGSRQGRLIMRGTSQQTINMDRGNISYLEIDNTNGVVATGDCRMATGNLELRNGILDIGVNRFWIDDLYAPNVYDVIETNQNNYSATKMIRSAGNSTDGGFALDYVQNVDYTGEDRVFPVGIGTDYMPMQTVINGIASNSNNNQLTVIPVSGEHPAVAVTGEALNAYWKIKNLTFWNSGFTSSTSNINYNFWYNNVQLAAGYPDTPGDLNTGAATPEWIPGHFSSSTWTNESATNIDGANKKILFDNSGAGLGSMLASEFTVGSPTALTGTFPEFYSIVDGDWNNATGTVWSNTEGGTPLAAGIQPGALNEVHIQHEINIVQDNKSAYALYLYNRQSGQERFLDISTTIGHSFGTVYPMGTPSAPTSNQRGRFYTASNIPINADFTPFAAATYARFYYYGGIYTLPNNLTTYPSLYIVSAISGDTKTGPDVDITINGDWNIGSGSVFTPGVAANGDIDCRRILGYGKLLFPNTGSRTIYADGSYQAKFSGSNKEIDVENGGDGKHKLIVTGDVLLNDGIFDFYGDGGSVVDLYMVGSSNKIFGNDEYEGGTASQKGEIILNRLVIDKGIDRTDTVFCNTDFTLMGRTDTTEKALTLLNGTFIMDDLTTADGADTDINLTTGGADFVIPSTAGFEIRKGIVRGSGDNSGISLDGKLVVNGGLVSLDDAINNGNNYIEYSASGFAELEILNGTLTVGSQIRRALNTTTGVLKYNQQGGTVVVGKRSAPENNRGTFEILNTGSIFNLSNGTLTLSNPQNNPSIASLYLDPSSSSINSSTIVLGDVNTNVAQNFGIYSTINLPNLTISNASSNNPTAKLWSVPLTIEDTLTIEVGASFDADGLDLILNGDMISNGIFIHNTNTTYFRGNNNQKIIGSPTFYNLTKEINSDTLTINNDIIVDNNLDLLSGILNDNDNTLFVSGDITNNSTHIWGGTSDGIKMNGSLEQLLKGNGEFGKLTIENTNGVRIPDDATYTVSIDGELKMINGIFNISKNLLVLKVNAEVVEANTFGSGNMIQTNTSFTDAGVKKYFPVIGALKSYTFPIGSESKYTPITFDITNINAGGNIRMKAANERQSTITDDTDECCSFDDLQNVLQYHYLLEATNVSNFHADVTMEYIGADASVNNTCGYDLSHYIAARILTYGDDSWNKFDYTSVDEVAKKMEYVFAGSSSNQISGEYTAGIEQPLDGGGNPCYGAIPQKVNKYISMANGNWNVATNWALLDASDNPILPAGTSVPAGGPFGSIVFIEHEITTLGNFKQCYKTEIRTTGTLKINNTYGHRLGVVSGKGTLYSERGDIPAGIYDQFFADTGGTIEYGGTTDYIVLPSINLVNNLTFSGTGQRKFPNQNIVLNGNLTINGASIIQENTRDITVNKNIVKTGGSFEFSDINTINTLTVGGTTNSSITGDFTSANNAFAGLVINKMSGSFTTNDDVTIENELTMSNGVVNSSTAGMLKLTTAAIVTGGSNSSYINGKLYKDLNGNVPFEFPIGKVGEYRPLGLKDLTTRTQFVGEYFESNTFTSLNIPLVSVSPENRWVLEDVNDVHPNSNIKLYWGPETGVTNESDLRVAVLDGSNVWQNRGNASWTGNTSNGNLTSSIQTSFSTKQFTIGTVGAEPLAIIKDEFNATLEGSSVKIEWSSVEKNYDYFIIERSDDGILFDEFLKIEAMLGETSYLKYDKNPLSGMSYYRLKKVSFDSYENSEIVPVRIYNTNIISEMNIYPNPYISGGINIDIIGFEANENINITIMDITGRIILNKSTQVNNARIQKILEQSFSEVGAGYYIVSIRNANQIISSKVIKGK